MAALGPTALRRLLALAAVAAVLLASACEPRRFGSTGGESVRVVSLSPAITQMVSDLGFAAQIVAAGRFDPVAPQGARRVGDLHQIDYERLLSVEPTHIFLQPGTQGVPPRLRDLARARGWKLYSYDIETVDDVLEALYDPRAALPEHTVGGALGVPALASALVHRTRERLERIATLHLRDPLHGVLLLVGLNPITAAGQETFLSELLMVAGGRNVLPEGGERYPVLDLERLVTLEPQAIIYVRSTTSETPRAGDGLGELLSGVKVPAVDGGRVHEIEDPVALLPSTTMPRIAGKLAEVLYPQSRRLVREILEEGAGS